MIKLRSLLLLTMVLLASTFVFGQTTVVLNDVNDMQDAMVANAGVESTNFGTQSEINVYHHVNQSQQIPMIFRTFIKYDLSSIPSNAIITSATLKLTPKEVDNTHDHPIYIERVSNTGSWTETNVNWNNQPDVVAADQLKFTQAQTSNTSLHTFELRTQVQFMVNNPNLNNGWRIRLQNEQQANTFGMRYHSKEANNAANRPVLEITYMFPVELEPTVTHCTPGNNDGSVSIQFTGGTPYALGKVFFYETIRDITKRATATLVNVKPTTNFQFNTQTGVATAENLKPGVYVIRFADKEYLKGVRSADFYKHILVGREGEETTCIIVPNAFQEHTTISIDKPTAENQLNRANTNYYTGRGMALRVADAPNLYENASLVKYQVDFDRQLSFSNVDLHMTAWDAFFRFHYSSNATNYSLITSPWEDHIVTWNTRPSIDSTVKVSKPTTTPIGFDRVHNRDTIDMKTFVDYWQEHPEANHGIEIALETYGATQYAQRSYRASGNDQTYLELKFKVKDKVLTTFDDASNTGTLTVNAPQGNLPYTYLINNKPLGTLADVWDEIKDDFVIDSAQFFLGKVNSREFTFDNLLGGDYFVAVYDNSGAKIFEGNGKVIQKIEFYNQTNLELSSNNEIRLSTGAQGIGNGRLLGELQKEENWGGLSLSIVEVGDMVIGFNNTSDSLALIERDINFGLKISETNNSYNVIVNGLETNVSGTINDGADVDFLKQGNEYTILIDNSVVFKGAVSSIFDSNISFDAFLSVGSLARVGFKHYLWGFKKGGYTLRVKYPECGENLGNLFLVKNSITTISPSLNLVNNHTGEVFYPTVIVGNYSFSNIPIGSYTLNGSYSMIPPTGIGYSALINEQVAIGYVVEWENLIGNEVISLSSSLTAIQPSISHTGFATSQSKNRSSVDAFNWVQFETQFPNLGSVIPGLTSENMSFTSGDELLFKLQTSPLFGVYSNGFLALSASGIWRVDESSGLFELFKNNESIVTSGPSEGQYKLDITQWGNARYQKVIASFCSNLPILDLYVEPKRELEGGYFLVPEDDILRFEFQEEYTLGNTLNYSVKDFTGLPLIGLSELSEIYGDNRFSLDVSSVASGVYIMEIINDKGENWFIRFKVQ